MPALDTAAGVSLFNGKEGTVSAADSQVRHSSRYAAHKSDADRFPFTAIQKQCDTTKYKKTN
jgi:hypothetical protein